VRRNERAGEDGELGGGSGISQANAAGETVGGPELDGADGADGADADGADADGPELEATVLEDGALEDGALEDGVPATGVLDAGPLDGDGGMGAESAAGGFPAAALPGEVRAASLGRVLRDGLRLSAGKAGTSTMVASRSAPSASALPGVAVSVEPAGDDTSFTPLTAVLPAGSTLRVLRSEPLPLAGAAGPESAWAVFFGVRCGAAAVMLAGLVSCPLPSARSSSPTREVTMVGDAPPDPSGLFVRLSKPSSL
jgi:hypothetical protein